MDLITVIFIILMLTFELLFYLPKYVLVDKNDVLLSHKEFLTKKKATYHAYLFCYKDFKIVKLT